MGENSKVVLRAIEQKRKPYFRFFQFLPILTITAMLFSIIVLDNINLTIAFLFITGISLAVINLFKGYSIIGGIVLSENQIQVNLNDQSVTYDIKSIESVKITCNEYEGERYSLNPNSMSSKKGIGNRITLQQETTSRTFEFFLKQTDIRNINTLAKEWRNQQVSIFLVNKRGKTVEYLNPN